MNENPFTVLGLNADTLRGLSETQLDIIIEGMRKLQSRLHHPDTHGRDVGRFMAITAAARSLGDPTIRRLALEDILGAAKGKLRKLQEENLSLLGQLDNSYGQMAEFMAAPWRSNACMGLRSVRLLIHNRLEQVRRSEPRKIVSMEERGIQFTLAVADDGSLSQQLLATERVPVANSITPQDPEWGKWKASAGGWTRPATIKRQPAQIVLYPATEYKDLARLHLIGTIDRYSMADAITPTIRKMLGYSSEHLGKISQPHAGFPVSSFALLLPALSPEFTVGRQLVAINDEDENPRLVILGNVQAIAPLHP